MNHASYRCYDGQNITVTLKHTSLPYFMDLVPFTHPT